MKKKRYIPFDRIQSLDYTEGILHRPFKLVKVKVETAGSSTSKKAEAELTAITKEAAERIEREIADAKSGKRVLRVEDGEDAVEFPIEEEPQAKPIFKMSAKDLLILATTSGGIGIILSGAAIFLSQFAELIPFEWMYEELSGFIKFGALLIAHRRLFRVCRCMGIIGCDDILLLLRVFGFAWMNGILSLRVDCLKRNA